MTQRQPLPPYCHTRYLSLVTAPPGLVAVYVSLSPQRELFTDPVYALAIRETWSSRRLDGDYDPEQDHDHDTEIVGLTLADGSLEAASDTENCLGIFPLADLTADCRDELIDQHARLDAARRARESRSTQPRTA